MDILHVYKLDNGFCIRMEWNIPDAWYYTLYDADGTAVRGGEINDYSLNSYAAAQQALLIMDIHSALSDIQDRAAPAALVSGWHKEVNT